MLWYGGYDAQAPNSGYSDTNANFEDDWTEWQSFLPGVSCPQCVSRLSLLPFAAATDPVYHQIYLSGGDDSDGRRDPGIVHVRANLDEGFNNGTQDPMEAAISIMTFIHESYHLRYVSGDELVNACALRDFPYWLWNQFEIPATNTVTVPQTWTNGGGQVQVDISGTPPPPPRSLLQDDSVHGDGERATRRSRTLSTRRSSLTPTRSTPRIKRQAQPYNTGTCTEPAIG